MELFGVAQRMWSQATLKHHIHLGKFDPSLIQRVSSNGPVALAGVKAHLRLWFKDPL